MTARQITGAHQNAGLPPTVALAAAGLAAASAIELLILRTFTRTAIHIPGITALREPYEVLSFGGRYAYFVSVALLMFALPGAAWALWRTGGPIGRGMAGAVAAFAAMSALAALGLAGRLPLDAATTGAVFVIAIGGASASGRWNSMVPLGLFAGAFVLSATHTLAQSAAQEGFVALRTDAALTAAEVVGVAFAVSVPLLARGTLDRLSVVAGAGAAVVVFAAFLVNGGATARFLLLWNEGLSGALPSVAYAAAAGCLTATLVAFVRTRHGLAAAGLVLLVTGGIGLHSTYQSGLVICGLAMLALGLWMWPAAGQRGRLPATGAERDARPSFS